MPMTIEEKRKKWREKKRKYVAKKRKDPRWRREQRDFNHRVTERIREQWVCYRCGHTNDPKMRLECTPSQGLRHFMLNPFLHVKSRGWEHCLERMENTIPICSKCHREVSLERQLRNGQS